MKTSFNRILFFLIGLATSSGVLASHNRAGEIIYKRTEGNSYRYEISIITYTKTGGESDKADRMEQELFFGYSSNGTPVSQKVKRVNGPTNGNGEHLGEQIAGGIKLNIYTTTHTFPGPGKYKLKMEDPNRNDGVLNIPNSGQVAFYLESELVIDVGSGGNNAPILQNAPIDNGCVNLEFVHNPGAVDPDGDSLVYSLVKCKTAGGVEIPGYQFPDKVYPGTNNVISIDARSGTMRWNSPQQSGEYNVAIRIEEYRYINSSGKTVYMGYILRDMQITIGVCSQNPPYFDPVEPICVEAGTTLNYKLTARDLDENNVTVSATGFPIDPDNTAAILPSNPHTGEAPLETEFKWNTNCSHVRKEPYWIYFKVKEELPGGTELVDFTTLEIQVVPPRVTITDISPSGSILNITWTQSACDGADGYDIYRYNDSLGFYGTNCNVGVPEALGYQKVGRVEGIATTTFADDNNGEGLIHGQRYCYMIVATWPDRSESYASVEACGELIRDVPIINKVSVHVTDSINGVDSIAWYKPTELDTIANPGPYKYELQRSNSLNGSYETIYTSPLENDFLDLDTVFVDGTINTAGEQHFYRVLFYSGPQQTLLGNGRAASSIYLSSQPSDNALNLTWSVDVPWFNSEFILYKFKNHPDSLDFFDVLDTLSSNSYVDRNLKNLQPYRYFVRSFGKYTSETLPSTLINLSQIHTGIPMDLEAPCTPPGQYITGDCNLDETNLVWRNPNTSCDSVEDVVGYRVYYAAVLGQEKELIAEINNPLDTMLSRATDESIAGCYAVTAIDSFGNESEVGEALCIDNCPVYELPNVFTPGADRTNDFFRPFPYKFIESIDLVMYNRWGVEVFKTTDPDIMWDGTFSNGEPLPSGVYFYVCTVNEIRLTGIVTRHIYDHVTILREGSETTAPAP